MISDICVYRNSNTDSMDECISPTSKRNTMVYSFVCITKILLPKLELCIVYEGIEIGSRIELELRIRIKKSKSEIELDPRCAKCKSFSRVSYQQSTEHHKSYRTYTHYTTMK